METSAVLQGDLLTLVRVAKSNYRKIHKQIDRWIERCL